MMYCVCGAVRPWSTYKYTGKWTFLRSLLSLLPPPIHLTPTFHTVKPISIYYIKKVGLEPLVVRIGAYKSAGDTLNRRNSTEEFRMVQETLVRQVCMGMWIAIGICVRPNTNTAPTTTHNRRPSTGCNRWRRTSTKRRAR